MAKTRESFLRRQRERKRQEKAATKREKRLKRRESGEADDPLASGEAPDLELPVDDEPALVDRSADD